MTSTEFQNILVGFMRQGLQIEMYMRGDTVWFDLSTGMKSELHIAYNEEQQAINYKGRYGLTGTANTEEQLLDVVRDCEHGRGFANSVWYTIIPDLGQSNRV